MRRWDADNNNLSWYIVVWGDDWKGNDAGLSYSLHCSTSKNFQVGTVFDDWSHLLLQAFVEQPGSYSAINILRVVTTYFPNVKHGHSCSIEKKKKKNPIPHFTELHPRVIAFIVHKVIKILTSFFQQSSFLAVLDLGFKNLTTYEK